VQSLRRKIRLRIYSRQAVLSLSRTEQ